MSPPILELETRIGKMKTRIIIPSANIKGGLKHAPFHAVEHVLGKFPRISETRNCIFLEGKKGKLNSGMAKFDIPEKYISDEKSEGNYFLRMRGMYDLFKYLGNERYYQRIDYSTNFYGKFKITVNDSVIFNDNIYFMGCRAWRFWPSVRFDIPAGILIPAGNRVLVENCTEHFVKRNDIITENDLTDEILQNTIFALSDIRIVCEVNKNLDATYYPEIVQTGEQFFIEIFSAKKQRIKINYPDSLQSISGKSLKLNPGRNKIQFRSVEPDSDIKITFTSEIGNDNNSCIINRIVAVTEGFIPKIGHAVGNIQSRNIIHEIETVRDAQLGNFIGLIHNLIRHDPNPRNDYMSWIKYCSDNNLYYSICPENYNREKWIAEIAEIAYNDYKNSFFSIEQWERGFYSSIYKKSGNRNLKQDSKDFIKFLQEKFSESNPHNVPVNFWVMEPSLLQRYHMMAGASFPGIEGMVMHQTLNIAAARGTARAYNAPYWAVCNALDCQAYGGLDFYEQTRKYLPDLDRVRHNLWWISQYTYYLSGARVIETQSGVINSEVNWHYDFEDEYQQKIAEINRDFYHFTKTHKLTSQPETTIAFVQGRYDLFAGGSYDTEEWISPAELSWRNIAVAMPGVSFRNFLNERDQMETRRSFSDATYGEVDILPVEAPLQIMQKYSLLIFLGWNTITLNDYQKLTDYVRNGGKVFMMMPHLSISECREDKLKIINEGDLTELFGCKIASNEKYYQLEPDISHDLLWEAEFIRNSSDPEVNFPVGEKFPVAEKDGFMRFRNWDTEYYIGNLKVNSHEEIIMRDAWNYNPLLVEHQLDKGYAYLLNICNYPKDKNMYHLIQNILKSLLESVPQSVKLLKGKYINYYEYLQNYNNIEVKKIFVIRNDWRMESSARQCSFLIHGKRLSFILKQREVKIIYAMRNAILIPDSDTVIIDDFMLKNSDIEFRIQSKSKVTIKYCEAKLRIKSITAQHGKLSVDKNKCRFTVEPESGMQTRIKLKFINNNSK